MNLKLSGGFAGIVSRSSCDPARVPSKRHRGLDAQELLQLLTRLFARAVIW